MMRYFCTYFDRNYESRALALYHSLSRHCPDFHLFTLCLDETSLKTFRCFDLKRVTAIPLEQLEKLDPSLIQAKKNRNLVEYYWTCGPSFILYVLKHYTNIDLITYVDADMFFFSDVSPIYDELKDYSVGIVEHRFSKRHEKRKKFGLYNVGWLSFRRDENGLQCVEWWRDRCIEWCYDRLEDQRYGDQKYLDAWPTMFKKVHVIQHKGVNVGPWNIVNYEIKKHDSILFADEQPLICFHFHGLKELLPSLYDTNLGRSGIVPSRLLRQNVYGTYINEIQHLADSNYRMRSIRHADRPQGFILHFTKKTCQLIITIMTRSYIVFFRGHAL